MSIESKHDSKKGPDWSLPHNSLDFPGRLWDKLFDVYSKSRASKHTAKHVGQYFAEMAAIEEKYAAALAKLNASPAYGQQLLAQEGSTVAAAWSAITKDTARRAESHASFAKALADSVAKPLAASRTKQSDVKAKLEKEVEEAQLQVKRAADDLHRAQRKVEQAKYNVKVKGPSFEAEYEEAVETEQMAQVTEYQKRNQVNRAISGSLEAFEEMELERLRILKQSLATACKAHAETAKVAFSHVNALGRVIQEIDELADTEDFVKKRESGKACPWLGDSVSSAKQKAADQAQAAAHSQTPSSKHEPVLDASPVLPAAVQICMPQSNSPRNEEGGMPYDASTFPENNEPLAPRKPLASMSLESSRPEIPYPTKLGEKENFEAPSWSLVLETSSEWTLSEQERRCICYETLLLCTNRFEDVPHLVDPMLEDTLRTQFGITKPEHDVLASAIAHAFTTLQSQHQSQSQTQTQTPIHTHSPSSSSSDPSSSPSTPSSTLSAALPLPALSVLSPPQTSHSQLDLPSGGQELSPSIMHSVAYRVDMCRLVDASTFANSLAYKTWYKRQLSVLLASLLSFFSMAPQQQWSLSPAVESKQPTVLKMSTNEAHLYAEQLITRTWQSFSATVSLPTGDLKRKASAELANHLSQIEGLLADISLSLKPNQIRHHGVRVPYPRPLAEQMYFLMMRACERRPIKVDDSPQSDEEEESAELHKQWKEIVEALSPAREIFKISERWHLICLLHCFTQIIHDQEDFVDSPLDADCLVDHRGLNLKALLKNTVVQLVTKFEPPEPAEAPSLFWLVRKLGSALADYHKYESAIVADWMGMYLNLLRWLKVLDYKERCVLVMRHSADNYYRRVARLRAEKQHDDEDGDDSADEMTLSAGHGLLSIKSKAKKAQVEFKPLKDWTSADWFRYSGRLIEIIKKDVHEFGPCLNAVGVWMPCQFTLTQFAENYGRDISTYLIERAHSGRVIDETLVALLQVMSSVESAFLSSPNLFSENGKHELVRLLPNVNEVAGQHMKQWLVKQREQTCQLRQRCQSLDKWTALGDAIKHSSSASDFLAILFAKIDAFFQHLKSFSPYGYEYVPMFTNMLNNAIMDYCEDLVNSCGTTESVKPSQALSTDKLLKKKKGLFKRLLKGHKPQLATPILIGQQPSQQQQHPPAPLASPFGFAAFGASSSSSLPSPSPLHSSSGSDERKSEYFEPSQGSRDDQSHGDNDIQLDKQSLSTLCARLSCLQFVLDKISALTESVKQHYAMVLQDRKQPESKLQPAKSQYPGWDNLRPALAPPPQINDDLFDPSRKAVLEAVAEVYERIAVWVTYVGLRDSFINHLYNPVPSELTRFQGTGASDELDKLMSHLYGLVYDTAFRSLVRFIFNELLGAVQWVVLFGQRNITQEHIAILKEDMLHLYYHFEQELDDAYIASASMGMNEVIATLSKPNEELFALFERLEKTNGPLPGTMITADAILHMLSQRKKDKTAKHFVKAVLKNRQESLKSSVY